MLDAWPRSVTGHKLSGLRKEGRTPAILFSLPQNTSQLLALDSQDVSSLVRAAGFARQAKVRPECRLGSGASGCSPDAQRHAAQVKEFGRSGLASRRFTLRVNGEDSVFTDYPVLARPCAPVLFAPARPSSALTL